MFKSKPDLILEVKKRNKDLSEGQVEQVVETLITQLCHGLAGGKRVEVRDFATFKVSHYPPRKARNPRTGESIMLGDRFKPSFNPGKKLREMVKNSCEQEVKKR